MTKWPWYQGEVPEGLRLRFAPSPTGELHVGGARTALFNYLFAKSQGGKFLLRIEDTDAARSTDENTRVILDGLRWLGLDWDEGPEKGGPCAPYFQSQRADLYAAALDWMLAEGHAYRCFLTAEELQAQKEKAQALGQSPLQESPFRDADPKDIEARLQKGEPHTLRLKCPDEEVIINDLLRGEIKFDARQAVGDFILRRSDGPATYNFVVVVDDLTMGISHVLRGDDHLSNTPKQAMVMKALGATPPVYAHVPLIHGMDGKKLSKRHGAASVLEYQKDGYLPEAVVNFTALLGWNPGTEDEVQPLAELINRFKPEDLRSSAARFDFEKLQWMNGVYLRALPQDRYLETAWPWLDQDRPIAKRDEDILLALWERIKTLGDLPTLADFFYHRPKLEKFEDKAKKLLEAEDSPALLHSLITALEPLELEDEKSVEEGLRALVDSLGEKPKKVFQLLRAATTGRLESPPLFLTLRLIGKEEVLIRLEEAKL